MGAFNCGAFVAGIVRVRTALDKAFQIIFNMLLDDLSGFSHFEGGLG